MSDQLNRALAGRYEILREAGRGARAIVYLARDLRHDREVALKVLRPEFTATVGRERFQREIGIAAKMAHPHILPLFDSGQEDGVWFYVTPFVEGETLRDLLAAQGAVPVSEAVRLAGEIGGALAYAHKKGVVHRDIKPENILLEDGKAVVADFGIAWTLEAAEGGGLTATGVSVGTPVYMSPEQGLGTPGADERADIYALGCVLFEMLVGSPPFSADSPRVVMAKKLGRPPPSPLGARRQVPVWLDRLVLKMLATEPKDRLSSADAFLKELNRKASSDFVTYGGPLERWAYRAWRRKEYLLAAAAVVILGLLGFLALDEPPLGTSSRRAWRAFQRGQVFLDTWNLAAADSAFTEATEEDWAYAEAHLGTALARAWRGMDPVEWRGPALRAAQGGGLTSRDSLLAQALAAQGSGAYGVACSLWDTLTVREPEYFGGWFGVAECQVRDETVVPDPNSPSGWRFRTSYHQALEDYRQAFELFPDVLVSYRRGSFASLRYLFMTSPSSRRSGRSEGPQAAAFRAVPAWSGDTLALIPFPANAPERELTVAPDALEAAVRNQRILFRDVVLGWVSSAPGSAAAKEALALALSMLGDPEAVPEINAARFLAANPSEGNRLAAVEAMMRLAFSLPDEPEGVETARALADSVLAADRPERSSDPLLLAGVSVLLGKADLAAKYMQSGGVTERIGGPVFLRESGPVLLVYAALGGPADTLRALETRIQNDIDHWLPAEERWITRLQWLARPATLAFHQVRLNSITDLDGEGDYVLDLQAAWARGDTAAVLRGFDAIREAREGLLASSVTMDSLLPEVELLFELGDYQRAADRLDSAFGALPQILPSLLTDPVRVGSLVRAAALRARIAHELGDRDGAALWSSAVRTLWQDCDSFLAPRVRGLEELNGYDEP